MQYMWKTARHQRLLVQWKKQNSKPEKGGKGNRTAAIGDAESVVSVNPSDSISNVGAISNMTLGQVMQIVGAARGNTGGSTASTRAASQATTATAQGNGASGISRSQPGVIGATRTRPKFPGGLLLVDSGAVDTCFPEGTFDAPIDTSQRRELYGIEGSLIRNNGRQNPVVKVGP